MNKRGQIYIIAALILSVVIFLLVSQTNFVQRILIEDDFEQLSKNFDIESAKFMNSLLAEDITPELAEGKFRDFTEEFSEFAKVENPDFEFIYILEYKGQKLIGYYIKEDIEIGPPTTLLDATILTSGATTVFGLGIPQDPTAGGTATGISDISYVKIGDFNYNLELVGWSQIVIISREKKGEQTKVYMNEEFVEGEKVS